MDTKYIIDKSGIKKPSFSWTNYIFSAIILFRVKYDYKGKN